MSKDEDFNAWITSSKFLPAFKHTRVYRDWKEEYLGHFSELWEEANWKNEEVKYYDEEDEEEEEEENEEENDSVIKNNAFWLEQQLQEDEEGDNYFVANPLTWIQMYHLYHTIAPHQLIFYGLFQRELVGRLNRTGHLQLKKILLSALPTPECIREQLKYIYGDPIRFLLLINYNHAQQGMLKRGRTLKSKLGDEVNDEHFQAILSRYAVDKRVPKEIIDEYLNTPHLQRYLLLNRTVLRAPYCKSPLILFRGESEKEGKDRLGLFYKKSGYRFVNNGLLSTSLDVDMAMNFSGTTCCLFIYHITDQVPRLFTNVAELEILLPAGLEMEFVNKERIGSHLCFRIKVLRVVEETIDIENRGKENPDNIFEIIKENDEGQKDKFLFYLKQFKYPDLDVFPALIQRKLTDKNKFYIACQIVSNLRNQFQKLAKKDLLRLKNVPLREWEIQINEWVRYLELKRLYSIAEEIYLLKPNFIGYQGCSWK